MWILAMVVRVVVFAGSWKLHCAHASGYDVAAPPLDAVS
jgi:hypothetical protein